MRKFTLFLMSLFLTVGAMAQTPVLELTADQIGTTYPKQLSDEDAAKVYELNDLTVAVRVITEGTSGRRGLFVTSDPTLEKNTDAEGTGSRYVAYGLYAQKLSYLASWKDGDRFTGNDQTFAANEEITCVYVINPTNGKCELYIDGERAGNWSGNLNGFSDSYEIATPKMVKTAHADAKIYLGGGMSSAGAGEIFGGRILGVKVYSGALGATEIAAITFEDPELLAQAREAFNTAYSAAQTILNEAELNVTSTELTLQASDENEPYYLWCNKPETSEGSINSLFDGSVGVQGGKTDFFHTNYSDGNNQSRYHYIEVDLGEGNSLSEFSFGYNTRNNNGVDFPDKIYVLGSNVKNGEYTQIYSVESGLPQSAAARWDSEIVSSEIAYRYIRFNVDAERTYWHMSEFDMFTNNISVAPKYSAVAKEVAALKNIYDAHTNNTNYTIARLNEAAAAINALVETVNAGTVEPEFSYESIDKPTFAKGGNTTKVGMIDFNGQNLSGFTYTQGATEHFNMPQVEAGKTYSLNLTYEMAWGDLAIFQIDKNSAEKKYGYYTCVWEADAVPFDILVNNDANKELMCEELGISSLDDLDATTAGDYTYLTIPYQITIDENLEGGDIVVVRVMVGKSDNGAYNAKDVSEGGCLDLVFTVKDTPTAYTFSQVTSADLMAKTEPTYIAIKNLSATNHHWFVGNAAEAPYSVEEFSDAAIFIWEPTTDGFYLKKLDGTYLQKSASIITYGTIDNAAVFTTTNPTSNGEGSTKFNGDGDSQAYINGNDDANLVRFVNGEDAWINVQNAASGTPKYNTGLGGWTIHYVYEIAEVEEFTVNISDAQFSTFYAQKNVVLPDNATAYIIDGVKDNIWLNLVEVEGVLPANTGILLYSETPVECKLTVTNDAATAVVTDNKLAGTIYNSYIAKEENNAYYILSKDNEGNVGMYNPVLGTNTARFKNGANKAYLVLPATGSNPAAHYSLRFDGEGTTGVENVEVENVVKTIYDLTGRKVETISAPGIYIINGVKRVVR